MVNMIRISSLKSLIFKVIKYFFYIIFLWLLFGVPIGVFSDIICNQQTFISSGWYLHKYLVNSLMIVSPIIYFRLKKPQRLIVVTSAISYLIVVSYLIPPIHQGTSLLTTWMYGGSLEIRDLFTTMMIHGRDVLFYENTLQAFKILIPFFLLTISACYFVGKNQLKQFSFLKP